MLGLLSQDFSTFVSHSRLVLQNHQAQIPSVEMTAIKKAIEGNPEMYITFYNLYNLVLSVVSYLLESSAHRV